MNTQEILSMARFRSYTDEYQFKDVDAVKFLTAMYKDARSRISQITWEDYSTDIFEFNLLPGVNTYSIPVNGVSTFGMDQIVSAAVDYIPAGKSNPTRMNVARYSSLPNAPDWYLDNQSFLQPFYVLWGDKIKVYPMPTATWYLFTVATLSSIPTAGAIYSNNGGQFKIVQTNAVTWGWYKVQAYVLSGTPSASGTLTLVSGTGPATISYSANVQSCGTMKIYANNLAGDLLINTDDNQMVWLTETIQKAFITGLASYWFDSRGQYDKSAPMRQEYEAELANAIALANERDAAPVKKVVQPFSQFQ